MAKFLKAINESLCNQHWISPKLILLKSYLTDTYIERPYMTLDGTLIMLQKNAFSSKSVTFNSSEGTYYAVTLKFIYSEKATKFCEISTLLLSYVVPVKSKVEISQNFVAFSEYVNFAILTALQFVYHFIVDTFLQFTTCCSKLQQHRGYLY